MPSFKLGKRDVIIIAVLIIAALAVWVTRVLINMRETPEKIYAEIIYESTVVEQVYLNTDRTFSIANLLNVIFEIKDHKIAFIQSDCPDKICVHSGWLEADGQFAACLPNRVLLRIVEENGESVDAVAR